VGLEMQLEARIMRVSKQVHAGPDRANLQAGIMRD
jgi:hypothetical protein